MRVKGSMPRAVVRMNPREEREFLDLVDGMAEIMDSSWALIFCVDTVLQKAVDHPMLSPMRDARNRLHLACGQMQDAINKTGGASSAGQGSNGG